MSAFYVLNLFKIFAAVDQVVFVHMEEFYASKVSAFPDTTLEKGKTFSISHFVAQFS